MSYSTSFVLKHPTIKEDSLVYMTFTFNCQTLTKDNRLKYTRLKYSTGEKISPDYWDFEKCRAKQTKFYPGYREFNTRLNEYKNDVEDIYRRLLNNGETPTVENLRNELNLKYGKSTRKAAINLFEFIEKIIANPGKEKDREISENTIKVYSTTLKHLKKYAQLTNKGLNFDDITLEFYYNFIDYLANTAKLNKASAGKYIKTLKSFMSLAVDRGYTANREYAGKRFIASHNNEEAENIYLTISELNKVYSVDLSDKANGLQVSRDLFLIGCYTGLRFSDFSQIKPENIYSNDMGTFLKVKTQKTGVTVTIPIHPIVKTILEKYSYMLPTALSNQKTNEYLKDIAREATITQKTLKTVFEHGKYISKSFEKCELVTTHTARRSFATNAILSGENPINVMRITGHSTEKEFMKYIKIQGESNAIMMQGGNFFSGSGSGIIKVVR